MRSFRTFTIGILALSSAAAITLPSFGGVASASPVNYADLGDSYAAGLGTDHGTVAPCYQSDQAFGPQWASKKGAAITFAACAGATTDDVKNSQVPQLSNSTTLVSVIAGGNDAGFVNVMNTCNRSGDESCTSAIKNAENYATTTLPRKLDAMYTAIHSKALQAKVIVLDYPLFYDRAVQTCIPALDYTKRQAIDDGIDIIDNEIKAAAERAPNNVTFEDVRSQFSGHELCDDDPWLHGANFNVSRLDDYDSYHPTTAGQSNGYLPAFTDAVTRIGR